VMAA